MKKRFNDNDAYFKWFDKNKNKIDIRQIISKNKIIVDYAVIKKEERGNL